MTPDNDQKPDDDAQKRRSPQYYRKARRKARKLGLAAENDEHAAALLEERGINVMNDDVSILDIDEEDDRQLVASQPQSENTGAITINDAERLAEIHAIERGLIRRRRLRLSLLVMRLLFFVALPTYLFGNYYYNEATDMYETHAEFVIQKSDAAAAMGVAGLLAGTGFATSADSIVVQGYLTSREALKRLDEDQQYRAHFQQDWIDDYQRLPEDATLEETYSLYEKNVTVGYDPTEGVIRLEVIAADPESSQRFANALIKYAEERVDTLSQRVREDQMKGATQAYADAEAAMYEAQLRVLELQQQRGVLSADSEVAAQMGIINSLELELEQKKLSLTEILDNPTPNQIRADALRADIDRLEVRIQELRHILTESTDGNVSIATISAELQIAEGSLATRQLMLQEALQQVESARIEANRQVRYLSLGVTPVAPDVPTYPRKFENTLLAGLIFTGIYLLLSLTISILREQVSV